MHQSRCYSRNAHSSFVSPCGVAIIDEKNRRIDVREKALRNLPPVVIQNRERVEHLNLDGNCLNENAFNMPMFPRLKSLSLKRNQIRDISRLLEYLRSRCPRLESLVLVGNPGWPLTNKGLIDKRYNNYRAQTESYLPHILFIDSLPTNRELHSRVSFDSDGETASSIMTTDSEDL